METKANRIKLDCFYIVFFSKGGSLSKFDFVHSGPLQIEDDQKILISIQLTSHET